MTPATDRCTASIDRYTIGNGASSHSRRNFGLTVDATSGRIGRLAVRACPHYLDDRFREPGIRGTGSVFVDSSFEFCLNEDWYHGNMAARSRVGDDRGGN